MSIFKKKQKGTIDVWWLYDDGGLTMLLPYIISTRQNWSHCKLRVFALANNVQELKIEEKKYITFTIFYYNLTNIGFSRSMADLLGKFRLEYSSLTMVQLSDRPKEETIALFNTLIEDFRTTEETLINGKL